MQLLGVAQMLGSFQNPDRGCRPSRHNRGQRGGENEARRMGTRRIHPLGLGCNLAAKHPSRLGQSAVDDVEPVHLAIAFGHHRAARPLHSHRVNLVEISQRAELPPGNMGQVAGPTSSTTTQG